MIPKLSDRQQYVTYNGIQSSRELIKYDVAQDSILSSFPFWQYINDHINMYSNILPFLFPDDTNLSIRSKKLKWPIL